MNNTGRPTPDDINKLFDQAQNALDKLQQSEVSDSAAASAGLLDISDISSPKPAEQSNVNLADVINAFSAPDSAVNLNAIKDLQLDVRVVLGEAELTLEDVMRLRKGSVVQLNSQSADPVNILVNGQLVARGEALNRNGKFCVRLTEILIK